MIHSGRHNPYIYDGWEQPERANTRCRRHSGLQPRYGSGHWIASLIPIPIGPLHAQVCKFNINIRKSSLYHDSGKINRNRGAFIHFSDIFHVTRLYQCNPHTSPSLTASLAILMPRHAHHFSRFQRLKNLRARVRRESGLSTPHPPVPQTMHWSKTESAASGS